MRPHNTMTYCHRHHLLSLVLAVLAPLSLVAQDPTVNVKSTLGSTTKSWPIIYRPRTAVTYTLSSGTADSTGEALLGLSITTSRVQPSGLQFDLKYTTADISNLTVTAGPSTVTAGKSLTCAPVVAGTLRCIISGTNFTTIGPGVVATVDTQVSPTTTAQTTTITLAGLITSSIFGASLTSISGGNGTISIPTILAGLTCDKSELETGEPSICTVSLSRAVGAPVTITLASDDTTKITVPVSVVVPAAGSSSTFTATGK